MWNATPTLYFLGRELEDHISNISHCLKKICFFLLFELIYLLFFVKNVKIVLVASEVL